LEIAKDIRTGHLSTVIRGPTEIPAGADGERDLAFFAHI
jgi:hypothetical protein